MKLYERLKSTLYWNKPIKAQLEALSQYDNLSDVELEELAKTCHKSTEAGILIEYLGYQKLIKYLPNFMTFLQDMNWPAAVGAAKMLAEAGRTIIPEIRWVFDKESNDHIWHYWILVGVIHHFDPEVIEELKPDLLNLIDRADKEGAATQALRILKENEVLNAEEVKKYYAYLLAKFEGDDYWINDLKEEIGF
ncbi:MAG: DUF5071 domain-containing protein [Bacteroidota bacterium]